jgi:hypothetical protein
MAAQRIHATAGHADVPKQKLDHRHGTDVLGAHRMLRPAECKHARHGPIGRGSAGDQLIDLLHLVFRRTADA